MIIDAEKFALSVLSSSDPQLSLEQKANLYEEAFNFMVERNKPFIEKQKIESAKARQETYNILKGHI